MRDPIRAACCIIASACASLPASKRPCAVGEDVVVSNQSLEWIRVYTASNMTGAVRQVSSLAPGEEATYSVDATARLQVMPIDRPLEPNGKVRIPKDIFVSCLEPID